MTTLYVVKGVCDVCQKPAKGEGTTLEDARLLLAHNHGDHSFVGNTSHYEKPIEDRPKVSSR